jgi:hypothetical protein
LSTRALFASPDEAITRGHDPALWFAKERASINREEQKRLASAPRVSQHDLGREIYSVSLFDDYWQLGGN